MASNRIDQAKPFVTLGVIVVVWLVVPTVIKTFTRASFFELTAPVTMSADYARVLQDYWGMRLHSNHDLIEAGRDLARINASYELAVQQNTELHSEIKRLEDLLKLPSFNEYRYEHARVARRDFSAWWQRIIIRKGRNYGIPVEAPVIFTGGVVGRVTEVYATTAVVQLVSDPEFRISGTIDGYSRPVSFQGGNNTTFAPPTGVAESVPLEAFPTPGRPLRLVTSGMGGVFPPGLTLGHMTNAELSPDGLFKTGLIKIDERLGALTEVTVLVPINPE